VIFLQKKERTPIFIEIKCDKSTLIKGKEKYLLELLSLNRLKIANTVKIM
jgi:hypothetical protein